METTEKPKIQLTQDEFKKLHWIYLCSQEVVSTESTISKDYWTSKLSEAVKDYNSLKK